MNLNVAIDESVFRHIISLTDPHLNNASIWNKRIQVVRMQRTCDGPIKISEKTENRKWNGKHCSNSEITADCLSNVCLPVKFAKNKH